MTSNPHPALEVPARSIPVPRSVSAEAQAVLSAGSQAPTPYPALDDHDAWRTMIDTQDEFVLSMLGPIAGAINADVEELKVDGVTVYVITPESFAPNDPRVYLDIHGGGLIMGGGAVCKAMTLAGASRIGPRKIWAVDYRMPPTHPYPAALDDCVTAYRALLHDHRPEHIAVGGGSAGGNLAASLMLRLRDSGLPLPAALVLNTPELDLTESGDSFQTNLGVDTVLTTSLMPANLLYANGHDLSDPYLSPLFADFTNGFPPTIISAGTRDLFLSNAVRMHWNLLAAGIEAELFVQEAAPHGGFFGFAPEDDALAREIRAFLDRHWTDA